MILINQNSLDPCLLGGLPSYITVYQFEHDEKFTFPTSDQFSWTLSEFRNALKNSTLKGVLTNKNDGERLKASLTDEFLIQIIKDKQIEDDVKKALIYFKLSEKMYRKKRDFIDFLKANPSYDAMAQSVINEEKPIDDKNSERMYGRYNPF